MIRWIFAMLLVASTASAQTDTECMASSYSSQLSALRTKTAAFKTWLDGQTAVNDAIGWCTLNTNIDDWIWYELGEAATYGYVPVVRPADYPANPNAVPDGCVYTLDGATVLYTQDEAKQAMGAAIAHAIDVDANDKVPWNLASESAADLDTIFDTTTRFVPNTMFAGQFFGWGDTNPLRSLDFVQTSYKANYDFATALTGAPTTQKAALDAVVGWAAANLVHIGDVCAEPNIPADLTDTLTTTRDGAVISRGGCHTTSKIMASLLRALNIPARTVAGWYAGFGHDTLLVPSFNLALQHGDDIYFTASEFPSKVNEYVVFDTATRWDTQVATQTPYPPYSATADDASLRGRIRTKMRWPSQQVLTYWCASPSIITADAAAFSAGNQFIYDEYIKRLVDITGCAAP